MSDPTLSDLPLLSAGLPGAGAPAAAAGDPIIRITPPRSFLDFSTLLGLVLSLALIASAIAMGRSDAHFFDLGSVMIVILGTLAVTAMSYTSREINLSFPFIRDSMVRHVFSPEQVARELLDIALITRKRGVLSLSMHAGEIANNPFLAVASQMVSDGLPADDIDRLLNQDMDIRLDGSRRAAGMLRRASEIAPAMGLIGTLVGLVQMLSSLDDPSAIGPAMALALLTTFYGAIMGSVVLAPLAAKLERNAAEDLLIRSLVLSAMLSISRQENPRKLEMELNSLLPPDQRIRYFDV